MQYNQYTVVNRSILTSICLFLNTRLGVFLFISLLIPFGRGYAQPVNNYIKSTMVHAPNAAALGKYGDIPVSYVTGVPDISVPIHTLGEGPLSMPISINYHASGIKISEMASWVGQGWSLFAGGTITRTVQGIADESTNGYYNTGQNLPNFLNLTQCCTQQAPYTDFSFLQDVSNGLKDAEPDLFSFNVGGMSGKFFIDYAAATSQGKPAYQFIPKQDLKLEFPPDFSSFTIISTDGTRYIFGKVIRNSVTVTAYDRTKSASAPEDQRFTTSWHLLRVESSDQKFKIELSYDAEYLEYWTPVSCKYYANATFVTGGNGIGDSYLNGLDCPSTGPGPNQHGTLLAVNGSRLTSIWTSTETVDFVASTVNRQDMSGSSPKSLSSIEVKAGASLFCKKFVFSYDYFNDPSGTGPTYKRLKLNQLQEMSCDTLTKILPCKFTYDGNFIRHRFSKAVDHWGYDNGATANDQNSVNCPPTTVSTASYGNSNRESVELHMKKGVLTEIKYPTGGKTTFTYEANQAYLNLPVYSNRLQLSSCSQSINQCCGSLGQNSSPLSFSVVVSN
jgi:hypothetical protein